jgi:hypothetical protein
MTTRFFFDTEFIEDGRTIELISIGMVSSVTEPQEPVGHAAPQPNPSNSDEPWVHGRFYAISKDCDFSRADKWVKENVIAKLPPRNTHPWITRAQLRKRIEVFIRSHQPPYEFWAYFADYDWVVFCQLFGKMIDLPDGFPMYCNDLKQEMKRLGLKRENLPPNENEHDALADAKWAQRCWIALRRYEQKRANEQRERALDALSLAALRECERAIEQRDKFLLTGERTAANGGTHDTCFRAAFAEVLEGDAHGV